MRNNINSKTTSSIKIIAVITIVQAIMVAIPALAKWLSAEILQSINMITYGISIVLSVVVIMLSVKDSKNNHVSRTMWLIIVQIVLVIVLIIGILKTAGILC